MGGQADRRRRGGRCPQRGFGAALARAPPRGAGSGPDGGVHRDVARAGAAARSDARLPRQPRQHADPGEGRDARAAPLRGRGLLRQDAECPPRGEHPPAQHGAGDRFAPAAAADPRQLRRPPRPALPLVGAADRRGVGPLVHRRGALLRRIVPAQHLARSRGAPAELPGMDSHPRLAREGSEALRSRAAGVAPLPRPLREVLCRGPFAGAAQGRCGSGARARLAHRFLRRVRVHGGARCPGRDHPGRSHALPLRVSPGADCHPVRARLHRQPVRGRPIHVQPLRLSGHRDRWGAAADGSGARARARSLAGDRVPRRLLPLSGQRELGAPRRFPPARCR